MLNVPRTQLRRDKNPATQWALSLVTADGAERRDLQLVVEAHACSSMRLLEVIVTP